MNWKRVFGAVAVLCLIGGAAYVLVHFLGRSPEPEPDPAPVYTIAVDAGHGGRDPGATAGDVYEKDINLEIAKKLRDLVDSQPDLEAVLIRSLDIFISLEDRILQAEEAGAIMYVTVHVNSFTDSGPTGVETIVADARSRDDDSWILAELIQNGVVEATGARDRGTRSQDSYTQRASMPAVSVETGYLTNPDERALLMNSEYQSRIAEGILSGIREFVTWKHPAEVPEEQP